MAPGAPPHLAHRVGPVLYGSAHLYLPPYACVRRLVTVTFVAPAEQHFHGVGPERWIRAGVSERGHGAGAGMRLPQRAGSPREQLKHYISAGSTTMSATKAPQAAIAFVTPISHGQGVYP
jgi:hypothetical protein